MYDTVFNKDTKYKFDDMYRMMTTSMLLTRKRVSDNIKQIISNPPATIIYWKDGVKELGTDKTVVKCMDGDEYNLEHGIAMCILKHEFGDKEYARIKKLIQKEMIKYGYNTKENENGKPNGNVSKDVNTAEDKAEKET